MSRQGRASRRPFAVRWRIVAAEASAAKFLPDDYEEVRRIFSRRGAYGKFKGILERRRALERWYAFEAEASERALREWCEVNGVAIVE